MSDRGHQVPTNTNRNHRDESSSNDNDNDDDDDDNDPKLVHIVHTRFMQHQGNLTTLGVARLEQFLAFCLPTMVHQTTQDFFWIIKVDPLLAQPAHRSESFHRVFEPLLEAVREANNRRSKTGTIANNIYVVGSNYNYNLQGHGSWRDGQEGEELLLWLPKNETKNETDTGTAIDAAAGDNNDAAHAHTHAHARTNTSTSTNHRATNRSNASASSTRNAHTRVPAPGSARVFTGDLARLRRAHELRESVPVLETRLDADDGLHRGYLETVQTTALERFLGGGGSQNDTNGSNANDANANANANANDANATISVPPKPRWLYWCIRTQIEWHSENNNNDGNRNRNDIAMAINSTSTKNNTNNNKTQTQTQTRQQFYYGNSVHGYLGVLQNDNYCITPGITVGHGVGLVDTDGQVPRYQHTKLWSHLHGKYKFCHSHEDRDRIKKGPCLELVGGGEREHEREPEREQRRKREPVVLHALRSRTLTSAGMSGIHNNDNNNNNTNTNTNGNGVNASVAAAANGTNTLVDRNNNNNNNNNDPLSARMEALLWKILRLDFGIDRQRVQRAQTYMVENRREIAYQNSLGQCTTGHSCKDEAKEQLIRVVRNSG